MATPAQYAAATAAVRKLLQERVDAIPFVIRRLIPQDQVQQFAADAAKVALDAVIEPQEN